MMTNDQAKKTICPLVPVINGMSTTCQGSMCQWWLETINPVSEYTPPGQGQNVFVAKDTKMGAEYKKVGEVPAKGRCSQVVAADASQQTALWLQGLHTLLVNRL